MSTNVKKKSTAQVFTKKGTNYAYQYTDLATIHEAMEAQKLRYYQFTKYDVDANADYIYTVLSDESGEKTEPIRGAKIISGNTLAGGNAAQEYGSALTYARRYSLLMALGWATEDDDGASAGAAPAKPQNQHYQGHADGRLDFDSLKSWLEKIETVDEVKAAKEKCLEKYPKMTEKQRNAVNRIFAERIDNIENPGEPNGWHEAIKA